MARRLMIVVGTVVVLAVASGVAWAHSTSFNSRVTIDQSQEETFVGTVNSPRPGCVRNRLVKLFREEGATDAFLGSDRTDQAGDWEVASPFDDVTYYARVTPEDIGGAGHNHICKADRSPDFTPEA